MRYSLPPLNAIKAFEATGRTGSLSAAARDLHVSVGAVSRHVSILESYFGCDLFERRHDGVVLTQWGKPLHTAIVSAFDTLDAACREVDRGAHRPIRLRTFTSLATDWLTPRLSTFRSLHPEVSVQLKQAFSDVSFASEPLDIAVTAQNIVESGVQQVELFDTIFTPVIAPSMRGGYRLDLLNTEQAPPLLYTRREVPFWEAVFKALRLPPPAFDRGLEFDSLSLTYQAARRGAGIALGLLFFIADDLKSGTLVPATQTCVDMELPHHLYFRTGRNRHPSIGTLTEWMVSEARKTNAEIDALCETLLTPPVLQEAKDG
ncbi:LysR substrate-binding domain-containing protein [Henriciella aquimarina]|uniref:LysR substrate-binding domain-containing protein n=1 Tax=Henriciella aquimarina TaxID=545261 RepID=UPI000A041CDE|nr:LysR substrate-binding domain-containing protein [Henriciella aquimarina]